MVIPSDSRSVQMPLAIHFAFPHPQSLSLLHHRLRPLSPTQILQIRVIAISEWIGARWRWIDALRPPLMWHRGGPQKLDSRQTAPAHFEQTGLRIEHRLEFVFRAHSVAEEADFGSSRFEDGIKQNGRLFAGDVDPEILLDPQQRVQFISTNQPRRGRSGQDIGTSNEHRQRIVVWKHLLQRLEPRQNLKRFSE